MFSNIFRFFVRIFHDPKLGYGPFIFCAVIRAPRHKAQPFILVIAWHVSHNPSQRLVATVVTLVVGSGVIIGIGMLWDKDKKIKVSKMKSKHRR